ncbi:MAG TPA: oxidoreductase [Salinimicrobium sp.]|nr:oxidoreductase [Salinimicrobium sp.]
MKALLSAFILICFSLPVICQETTEDSKVFTNVDVEIIFKDDVSIRAIEVSEKDIFYAGSNGKFGHFKIEKNVKLNDGRIVPEVYKTIANETVAYEGKTPEFRSVAETEDSFFFLSVDNPALLYRYDKVKPKITLVYTESAEGVFYDSMKFWNEKEGIAMGDPMNGCLSVIVTRNGGKSWEKLSCDILPATVDGEAAFAASNSNIAIEGDHTWIISGGKKSRVFHSSDKAETWEVFETPIVQGKETTGGYSIDFYDEKNGFIIGGDYLDPTNNTANKAFTTDGGKTWELVADGSGPGYKSSVKFVPDSNGNELVAVGGDGISYSSDGGKTWKLLSKEGFHSIEFLNNNTAFAAGNGKIAKLVFK